MAYETIGLKAVLEGGDKFLGDLRSIDSGVAKVGSTMAATTPKANSFGSSLKSIATIAAGFTLGNALMNLPHTFMNIVGSASNLNESMNKMQVVFGEASGTIDKFASGSASAVGLSKQAALEATATFGNLFTSMGLGKQASADMSVGMLQLAADIASFNNISVDEALMKLRSGLVGEAEPLRTVGILLDEETVKAKAMEMGLASSAKEVDSSAKVQARYALMLEQSKNATGDFARTSDGFANQQRILKANFQDLSAVIGTALLPVMQGLNAILIAAMPLLTAIAEIIANVLSTAINAVITVIKELGEAFAPIFGPILDQLGGLGGAWDTLVQKMSPVTDAIANVTLYLQALWEIIKTEVIPAFADWAGSLAGDLIGQLQSLGSTILNFIGDVVSGIPDALGEAKDAFLDFWESLGDTGQAIAVSALFGPGGPILTAIWQFRDELVDVAGRVWEFAQDIGDALLEAAGNAASFVADAADSLGDFAGDVAGWIGDAIGVIWDFAGDVADAMGAAAEGVAGLAGVFADAMGGIIDIVSAAVSTVYDLLSSLVSEVTRGVDEIISQYSRLPDSLDGLKDATEQLKNEQALLDDAIDSTKLTLEGYKNTIDDAEKAIQNLRKATIAEAVPYDEKSKAIDEQSNKIKLQINLLKQQGALTKVVEEPTTNKKGEVTGTKKVTVKTALGEQVAALEDQLEQLGLKAEEIDLQRKLNIGPLEEQIDKLTSTDLVLPFQQIVDGIKAQKEILDETVPKYDELNDKLSGMETASKNLKEILADLAKVTKEAAGGGGGKGGAGGGAGGGLKGLSDATANAQSSFENVQTAIHNAKEKLDKLAEPIRNIKEAWTALTAGFNGAVVIGEMNGWQEAAYNVGQALRDVWDIAQQIAGIVWDGITTAWGAVRDAILAIDWGAVGGFFASLGGVAWDLIKGTWEAIKDAFIAIDWGAIGESLLAWGAVAWDTIKEAAISIADSFASIDWGAMKEGAATFASAATDTNNWAQAWESLKSTLAPAVDYLLPKLQGLWSDLQEQFGGVVGALGELIAAFAPLQPLLAPLANIIGVVLVAAIGGLIDQMRIMVTVIGTVLTIAIQTLTGVVTVVVGAIMGFVNIVSTLIGWIGNLVGAIGGLPGPLEAVKGLFETVGNFLKDVFAGALNTVKDAIETLSGAITTVIEVALTPLKAAFELIQQTIDNIILPALQALADFFGSTVLPKFQEAIDFIGGMAAKVGGFIDDVRKEAVNKLGGVIGAMFRGGQDIVEGLWNGIQALADWLYGKVWNFAKGIFNAVKDGLGDLWPFSPSKAGVAVGEGLMLGIEKGIKDGEPEVETAVITMADGITRRLDEGFQTLISNSTQLLTTWKNVVLTNMQAGRELSKTEIQAMFSDILAAIQNSNLDGTTKQELIDVGRALEEGWRANGSLAVSAIVALYDAMVKAIRDGNAKAAAEAAKAPSIGAGGGSAGGPGINNNPVAGGGGTHKQYVGGGQYVDVPNNPQYGDTYTFGTYTDPQGNVQPLHTMTYIPHAVYNPETGWQPGWSQTGTPGGTISGPPVEGYTDANGVWHQYQSGIEFVPYNQWAFLHKGEMIIPAREAKMLRELSKGLSSWMPFGGSTASRLNDYLGYSASAPFGNPNAYLPAPPQNTSTVVTQKIDIDLSQGTWSGPPEENAEAIGRRVEAAIQSHLGRGAVLAGSRR
jgi:phage-related protein